MPENSDIVCCVCGKPGAWADIGGRSGFRLVANAIGYYVCGEACDRLVKGDNSSREAAQNNGE